MDVLFRYALRALWITTGNCIEQALVLPINNSLESWAVVEIGYGCENTSQH